MPGVKPEPAMVTRVPGWPIATPLVMEEVIETWELAAAWAAGVRTPEKNNRVIPAIKRQYDTVRQRRAAILNTFGLPQFKIYHKIMTWLCEACNNSGNMVIFRSPP